MVRIVREDLIRAFAAAAVAAASMASPAIAQRLPCGERSAIGSWYRSSIPQTLADLGLPTDAQVRAFNNSQLCEYARALAIRYLEKDAPGQLGDVPGTWSFHLVDTVLLGELARIDGSATYVALGLVSLRAIGALVTSKPTESSTLWSFDQYPLPQPCGRSGDSTFVTDFLAGLTTGERRAIGVERRSGLSRVEDPERCRALGITVATMATIDTAFVREFFEGTEATWANVLWNFFHAGDSWLVELQQRRISKMNGLLAGLVPGGRRAFIVLDGGDRVVLRRTSKP